MTLGPGEVWVLDVPEKKGMAFIAPLSIDPSGSWSEVQATKVLEIINPEAKASGVYFSAVDITTMNMPNKRFLLTARCIKHQYPMDHDSACPRCLQDELRRSGRAF